MGIRFDCPNGHRLHVKAYLAGRRGICPDCGARLLIPTDSVPRQGGTISADSPATNESITIAVERTRTTTKPRRRRPTRRSPGSESIQPALGAATATPAPSSIPNTDLPSTNLLPPESTTQEVWFIRPPAGGQYGPASDATFSRWIEEGRVVRDAYVWRQGWSTWQLVSTVIDRLPADLPGTAPTSVFSNQPDSEQTVAAKASAASAEIRRARRRSSRRHWLVAIVLLMLVIVLAGLLIFVLNSGA